MDCRAAGGCFLPGTPSATSIGLYIGSVGCEEMFDRGCDGGNASPRLTRRRFKKAGGCERSFHVFTVSRRPVMSPTNTLGTAAPLYITPLQATCRYSKQGSVWRLTLHRGSWFCHMTCVKLFILVWVLSSFLICRITPEPKSFVYWTGWTTVE